MIRISTLKGFEFEHYTTYNELLTYFKSINGYTQYRLKDSYGGLEIWGFSLGDLNKPTIFIEGQIHSNHEWGTSHWVSRFMELLVNPNELSQNNIFQHLKAKYSFYFIPCVNPDGYNRGINKGSYNDNGVYIDANFDYRWEEYEANGGIYNKGEYPFSEPESQNVRDVVNEILPVCFLDSHCWGGGEGVYIRRPANQSYDTLLNDYTKSIGISLPHMKMNYSGANIIPTAYNWAGEIMNKHGRKIIATVLETGNTGITQPKLEQSSNALNGILMFCIYVDHHLKTNELNYKK